MVQRNSWFYLLRFRAILNSDRSPEVLLRQHRILRIQRVLPYTQTNLLIRDY